MIHRFLYRTLLLFAAFFLQTFIHGQGEANNWYFGTNAGITFNTNPPTALTNGQLSTSEGCATISDANGNLLFYTDGIRVYNRNHVIMPNGSGLLGDPSSAQSGIIVPKPGSTTQYYVFTVPSNSSSSDPAITSMAYSEVDMTLNGGLGDIIAATKNTLMFSPSSEKVTAVKHANGLYYWVVGKERDSPRYRAYLVDCSGVNVVNPVISNGVYNGSLWGYMVISPDATKIASCTSGLGVEIGDFDNLTGAITNPIGLGGIVFDGYSNGNYGLAFSPNSQILYGSSITNWALVQWDLTAPNIAASQTFIAYLAGNGAARPAYRGGALQLGPDGKIYTAETGFSSLGVINNPDVLGTGCNYTPTQIGLASRICRLGLPPFIQSFFNQASYGINYVNNCLYQTILFSVIGAPNLDSLRWDFGDPASGLQNTSTLDNPSHIFSAAGTYNVRLIRYLDCVKDTVYRQIEISDYSRGSTSVTLCPGSTYILPGGGSTQTAGIYVDTLSGAAHTGCDSIITTSITIASPFVNAGNDTLICYGSSTQLRATSGLIYSWDNHSTLSATNIPNPMATPTQTTTYTVRSKVRIGNNLVVNGDFEAGNSGFSTGYLSSVHNPLNGPGHYTINTHVTNGWWPSNCGDHTSGSGNMLVADGANGTNSIPAQTNVWCQTVAVTPNTEYAFSTWLANMNTSDATSRLGFFINGIQIGADQTTPLGPCQWNEFYQVWNSGTSTSANICISERSGAQPGNDFALDDISFFQLCEAVDSVVVRVSEPLASITDTTHVDCFGNATGTASVTPSGGIAPFTYSWNNGQNDSTAVNLIAGIYTATVRDSAQCSVAVNVTITEPAELMVSISQSLQIVCFGDSSATLNANVTGGTLPYSYVWNSSPPQNTVSATGLPANTYEVSVTDAHNCQAQESFAVTEPAIPTSTITANICPGSSYILPGGGAANIDGFYVDTIPSSLGCDSIVTTEIIVNQVSITATSSESIICLGQSIQLNVTGGFLYTWDANPSLSSTTIENPTATPTQTTTYIVRSQVRTGNNLVINGNFEGGNTGFTSGYTPISGSLNQGQYVVTTTPRNHNNNFTNCGDHTSGSSLMMLVDGACGTNGVQAGTYFWCQTIAVTPNTDYAFSAWMTNVSNNNASSTLRFTINGQSIGNPPSTTTTACQWQEFYVLWNSGNNTTANICISEGTGVCSGNDFAVDDISFFQICETVDSVTVRVSNPQSTISGTQNVDCLGNATGSASVTTIGGTAPISYVWSNGQNGATANGLIAGNYSVVISDSVGCTQTLSTTISEPPLLQASLGPQDAFCQGNSTTITATANGGTQPYTLQWSNGAPGNVWNQTVSPLQTTVYTASVTDANGCIESANVTITVYPQPIASFGIQPPSGILTGDQITLFNTSTQADQLIWDMGDGKKIHTSNSSILNHIYAADGTFCVNLFVATLYGCTDSTEICIDVEPSFMIYAPNTITADGDGLNDVFKITGTNIATLSLSIYNRWGELLFHSEGSYPHSVSWDGTYMGTPVKQDVYVYKANIISSRGQEHIIHGNVTLLR